MIFSSSHRNKQQEVKTSNKKRTLCLFRNNEFCLVTKRERNAMSETEERVLLLSREEQKKRW